MRGGGGGSVGAGGSVVLPSTVRFPIVTLTAGIGGGGASSSGSGVAALGSGALAFVMFGTAVAFGMMLTTGGGGVVVNTDAFEPLSGCPSEVFARAALSAAVMFASYSRAISVALAAAAAVAAAWTIFGSSVRTSPAAYVTAVSAITCDSSRHSLRTPTRTFSAISSACPSPSVSVTTWCAVKTAEDTALSHACASTIRAADQVVTETLGEAHADEIAEKVRVGVRNECLDESQVMAEGAVQYAAGEVRSELPAIVQRASFAAATASATEIALEYEANMTAAEKADLANSSLGQPLNGSANATFTTTPPPPAVNITPNATEVPNITNASAPEPSAATPEPLELAPPPPLPSVNVTIGNRTVEGATAEPSAPTEPPPPPRVQQAILNAVAMAKAHAAKEIHETLLPAKWDGWHAHFASEMRR